MNQKHLSMRQLSQETHTNNNNHTLRIPIAVKYLLILGIESLFQNSINFLLFNIIIPLVPNIFMLIGDK